MKSQNQNTVLVSLMAALALYFPLAKVTPESAQQQPSTQQSSLTTQAAPPASPKPKASQTILKSERQGAAKLLCDFFGLQNQGGDNHPYDGDYCHIAENIPGGYQIEHIIATIPDPKESRMDYLFDRNLDAIQRAVEATGYVLDRYSLPWGIQKNSLPPTITLTSQPATLTLSTQGAQPQRDYSREPGIILFRYITPDDNIYNLLLIFLVGETPTTGIHKIAFRNALDQIKRLPPTANAQRTESGELKIRVMGPTFSGSSTPLAFSIKRWLEEFDGGGRPQVQIISGSATAMNKRNFLQLIGNCADVTFNATVPLDTQARSAFIEYLKIIDAISQNTRPEIAILAEANTAYGRESNPNLIRGRNRPKPDEKKELKKASLTCLPDKDPPAPEPIRSLLSLTFPLHISQLRSEAAKLKSPRNEAANKMPPQNVALPMSE